MPCILQMFSRCWKDPGSLEDVHLSTISFVVSLGFGVIVTLSNYNSKMCFVIKTT